jgi:hypothetical protein
MPAIHKGGSMGIGGVTKISVERRSGKTVSVTDAHTSISYMTS